MFFRSGWARQLGGIAGVFGLNSLSVMDTAMRTIATRNLCLVLLGALATKNVETFYTFRG